MHNGDSLSDEDIAKYREKWKQSGEYNLIVHYSHG